MINPVESWIFNTNGEQRGKLLKEALLENGVERRLSIDNNTARYQMHVASSNK